MSKPKLRKPKTEYTPPEIARMFGVTRQRVCQWIIEGKLPATRRGWHYYVAAADCHRPPKGKTGPKGPRKRKAKRRARGVDQRARLTSKAANPHELQPTSN